MTIEELLQKLHINAEPMQNENGSWTIELANSNEYSKYYTKLDSCDFLEEDDEASQVAIDTSTIQYVNDDFTITLIANFDTNEYKMVIREMQ